jgi:putative inorganic carbon (hco3(-)) transporter
MLTKDKIFLYCDNAIFTLLCFSIFCLPFARAGVETFTWTAIFIWIFKRILGYRADSLWGILPKTELNKALGLFIAVNVLSVIFTTNYKLSLRGFFGKELKFLAIYFMLVEVINSKKRLKIVLTTIIASAVLIVTDAGVQYYRGVDFIRGYEWARSTACFISANGFAGWLVVMVPLFLGCLISDKLFGKKFKVLLLALIIMLPICLLMTYARGAWLGFIIVIFAMAGYITKSFSLKTKIILSAVVIILAIFLFYSQTIRDKAKSIGSFRIRPGAISGKTINERIKSVVDLKQSANSIRIKLWKESLRITRDYPLTGCGLNTYSIVARRYKSFEGGGIYPHNSYFQMSAETGLLGLFAFLWVLFNFFRIGMLYLKQRKDYLVLGLLSGILAFLVHAFFDTHLYSLQLIVLFWYMLGLTVAVIKLDCKNNNYF